MATGLIPDSVLEDILSRIDIAEVISGYLPLKKAGRNFRCLCPFHHEKTPSFMVSAERQIYHFFGCGAGGNAFHFLMQYERLEFLEAVEALAKKAGVVLPKPKDRDYQAGSLAAQLYKVNELSQLFYENNLNSPAGEKIKAYLLKRGLTAQTIKEFRLGWSPDKWDSLISFLRPKNISLSLMEKAGLILAKEGGGYYDRFRNRIIFPILDIKSRPLGFGARALPEVKAGPQEEALPKYVNSPETPIYTKGRNLYGLQLSKDAIRDTDCAVMVEGYLDFILPYQCGVKNIVASLGTALTQEQARLIKRYTHNVAVVYDPDKAGELAALRSLDIFIEEEMNVRVVSLPAGLDPDLFVRKHSGQAFQEIISKASDLFDYKLRILKSRHNHKEVEGKVKICGQMLPTLAKIKNAVLKSEYIKKLAQQLDISEDALWQEIKKIKPDKSYPETTQLAQEKTAQINPTERLLIKLMLEEAGFIQRIRESLEPADFQDERVSGLVSAMFGLIEQGKDVGASTLMSHLNKEEASKIICESVFMPDDLSAEHKEKVVDDCIKRLKSQRLKQRRQHLHEQIKQAQGSGDEKKLNRLIEEFDQLIKQG